MGGETIEITTLYAWTKYWGQVMISRNAAGDPFRSCPVIGEPGLIKVNYKRSGLELIKPPATRMA